MNENVKEWRLEWWFPDEVLGVKWYSTREGALKATDEMKVKRLEKKSFGYVLHRFKGGKVQWHKVNGGLE